MFPLWWESFGNSVMNKKKVKKNTQSASAADYVSSPSKQEVYRAAKAYVASGLSLIPIRADGNKKPAFELLPKIWSEFSEKYRRPWGGFKTRPPTLRELRAWFRDSDPDTDYSMAILGGKVSGNLEIIDCDSWDVCARNGLHWSRKRLRDCSIASFGFDRRDPECTHTTSAPKSAATRSCASLTLLKITRNQKRSSKRRRRRATVWHHHRRLNATRLGCYTFIGDKDFTAIPTITAAERTILIGCGVHPQKG